MAYCPKTLEEQAYLIGREHGARRARLILQRKSAGVDIPAEFSGHGRATSQYLMGEHDGEAVVFDAHDAKNAAMRRDMIEAGAEEMDKLESGEAGRGDLPPGVGAVFTVVAVGGAFVTIFATLALVWGTRGGLLS